MTKLREEAVRKHHAQLGDRGEPQGAGAPHTAGGPWGPTGGSSMVVILGRGRGSAGAQWTAFHKHYRSAEIAGVRFLL